MVKNVPCTLSSLVLMTDVWVEDFVGHMSEDHLDLLSFPREVSSRLKLRFLRYPSKCSWYKTEHSRCKIVIMQRAPLDRLPSALEVKTSLSVHS